jgi:thiamine biosynthesis lipoprotein
LNDLFSDYDSDTELSRLCLSSGQGSAVGVSLELWEVLSRAQELSRQTGGAFDVTVGPYVNLWRKARREGKLPSADRLARAGRSVGYWNVRLDGRGRSVELLAPDMRLDLGGIAKGYAIDAALKVLTDRGIQSAMVMGGGDLAVSGSPPGRRGWRIELAPLDVEGAPSAQHVVLRFRALATSGDVFQRMELEGRRYSHIVDPRTGIGLTDQSLVTVIAADCTTADSLATAVSVLGPLEGAALLESRRGVAGRMLRKPAAQIEVLETRGFRRWLEAGAGAVEEGAGE